MGHFTTRYYTAAFDEASYVLAEACGLVPDGETGFADLELNMKFTAEIREGDRFYIKSGIIKLGNSSIYFQREISTRNAWGETNTSVSAKTTWQRTRQFDCVSKRLRASLPAGFPSKSNLPLR